MAAGLVALLDDVATMAKLAASSLDDIGAAAGRAGAKAAGVVVDDAAVTPKYVQGFRPERELPVIRKIAVGSLRNKLLVIVPVAIALSVFAPFLLPIILMCGGTYLCYEGAEKIWEKISGTHHGPGTGEQPVVTQGPEHEEKMVQGAIRTDFILSAEIMAIALDEVTEEPLLTRGLVLIVVAIAITALIYGVVGLIVKLDDIGLRLAEQRSGVLQTLGTALVQGTPKLLTALGVVGTAAMLWVGGHILLVGSDELGWHGPYDVVHHAEEVVADALPAVGGFAAWLVNTGASAIIGLAVGAVVVAIVHQLPKRGGDGAAAH